MILINKRRLFVNDRKSCRRTEALISVLSFLEKSKKKKKRGMSAFFCTPSELTGSLQPPPRHGSATGHFNRVWKKRVYLVPHHCHITAINPHAKMIHWAANQGQGKGWGGRVSCPGCNGLL